MCCALQTNIAMMPSVKDYPDDITILRLNTIKYVVIIQKYVVNIQTYVVKELHRRHCLPLFEATFSCL